MSLENFRLLSQLAAGRDGVTYRAEIRASKVEVELQLLETAAADHARWKSLSRRLRILPRIPHPSIRPLLHLELDGKPPFAVFAVEEGPLLAENRTKLAGAIARMGLNIAEALAASHRMSLVAQRLDPWNIWAEGPDDLLIDFSGIDAGSTFPPPSDRHRRAFQAIEVRHGGEPTFESDVFALGALMAWLATGQLPDERATFDALPQNELGALIRHMAEHDQADRLGLVESIDALEKLAAASKAFESRACLPGFAVEATGAWVSATPGTMDVPGTLAERGTKHSASFSIREERFDSTNDQLPDRLGRYRLLDKLGQGGMGDVYRAEDESDGTLVAVKVLRPDRSRRATAIQRFQKEARLLRRVQNPYVTRLLDYNEQDGFHYIVIELVEGESLDRAVTRFGALDETTALLIIADVARGLAEAHDLGIVHRDIKPANILLVERADPNLSTAQLFATPEPNAKTRAAVSSGSGTKAAGGGPGAPVIGVPRVKLSDFGLARQIAASESIDLTQEGMIVGTPSYMAPEQCTGAAIDARTDIYALGATLFHLVAGHPPFESEDSRALIQKHIQEPAPSLRRAATNASEGIERVVAKALAKLPEARYADAAAILHDIERLLRGEPTSLPTHPVLPTDDPRRVLKFDFSWDLASSPRQLWPHVSNTDRLDRALGFGAVQYSLKFDPARGVRRFLEGRKAGQIEQGEELPYEWIEGRRLGVYREYSQGPFHWVVSIVELAPRAGGGTTLSHKLRFEPRGRLIRFGSRWGVGHTMRRDLERIYGRIDAAISGKLGKDPLIDPFEASPILTDVQKARLDERLGMLSQRGLDPIAVERLGDFLAGAPDPELARIRPIALARKLDVSEEAMVDVCLHAAEAGLLVLLWDLICPACRLPSQVLDSLRSLSSQGHCEACQVDYQLDFAGSVELIFQAHPQIREADTKTYCAAGPAHSPHVVAQVRVAPGEHFELDLDLSLGSYRLRGPQLGWTFDFEVSVVSTSRLWSIDLNLGPEPGSRPALKAGGQVITLVNPTDRELVARIERSTSRDDALTAAKASTLAAFRALFPAEILAPGLLVSVSNVALLLTAIDQPRTLYEADGDPSAFTTLHEQFRTIEAVVKREGGTIVKTIGEGILAAFSDPTAATRAALSIPDALDANPATKALRARLKGSLHQGPAMAATLNDHLDYFGATVHKAVQALEHAGPETFALTKDVAGDPAVDALLRDKHIRLVILETQKSHDSYYGPILIMKMRTGDPIPGHESTVSHSLPVA